MGQGDVTATDATQVRVTSFTLPDATSALDQFIYLLLNHARYEWLHWVDLDTLFMNLKRSPIEFLDPNYDIHVAKDANGLNTGSFYVRELT